MKQSVQHGAAVILLSCAAAVVVLIVRGNDPAAWVFCGYCFVMASMQIRRERRTGRRYAARNQFECRVRPAAAAASRPRWARALATPYPDWLTLQPLSRSAGPNDDPLVLQSSDFAGMRRAELSESLFRFNPGWHIASFRSGGGDILLAAPSASLTAFIEPASLRGPQHRPAPEDQP